MKVGLVPLGCSKNLVDSEMILGVLVDLGFEIVGNPENADLLVINTCGFIQSAKEEAIETIFQMAQYKQNGTKLVVTGCLMASTQFHTPVEAVGRATSARVWP